jgi:hypothetical protein
VWIVSMGGTVTAGGTSTSNTVTVTWNTAGAQSVSVNYDNSGGCGAPTATSRTITVNARPTPTLIGPAAVCVDATGVTYTTDAGMTNYVWTVVGGLVTAGGTGNFVTVTWPAHDPSDPPPAVRVNYRNAAGCNAATPTILNVNVGATLVPGLGGDVNVCENETGVVYTTDAGQNNYAWTVSAGGTITAGGTGTDNTVTVTWGAAGNGTVTVNYDNTFGCPPSAPNTLNVQIHAPPIPTIGGGSATQCVTDVVTYSTEAGMTNYVWNVSAGRP